MSHSSLLTEMKENLVPFSARQVTTSLIWCSPDVDDVEALRNACSYMIDPASSAPAKIFHAERYGGSGLQRNGGGARCGIDGHYQVKGIGANPLVGEGTDGCHSNGTLGAVHAIYEALWGEVLAQILPYGAVRARAVLLTNIYTDKAFELSRGPSRRALLVREPVVRPAHFERAPYFRPQSEYTDQLMHDARRVSAVIRMLPVNLPTPSAGFSEETDRNLQRYCIEGLCELARREAWQMAFCRTRFLRLTTSPSNIAMDGKLLDFNGLSCLFPSDYNYDFGYRLRLTELMNEPVVLQRGLSDLCFYLGKYLFDPEFTLIARQQVEGSFQKTFQEACYHGYLELLGIPTDILLLKEIPDPLKQLVISFMTLLDNRNGTLHCPDYDDTGYSPLQRLVVSLIRCSQEKMVSGCRSQEHDVHFTKASRYFTEAIHWLVQTGRERGIDTSVVLTKMEQHAWKRLQPRRCLGKVQMSEEIADLLNAHGDDPQSLQKALYEMGTRMQAFAREALGHLQPVNYML